MKNKFNLPPFYIGQEVIYITGILMPKNSKHIISDLKQDPCGCWNIGIDGQKLNIVTHLEYDIIICDSCEKEYSSNFPEVENGWDPNSFRPVENTKLPLLTFKQIQKVEKEEVLILN